MIVENIRKNTNNCVLCGVKFVGVGNNPNPIKRRGVCCKNCNINKVLPARVRMYGL